MRNRVNVGKSLKVSSTPQSFYLRSDTLTGPDGIPVKFAKLVAESIAGPIIVIINNCIRTGYFPKVWKKARISPIPKIDNPKLEDDLFQFFRFSRRSSRNVLLFKVLHFAKMN